MLSLCYNFCHLYCSSSARNTRAWDFHPRKEQWLRLNSSEDNDQDFGQEKQMYAAHCT